MAPKYDRGELAEPAESSAIERLHRHSGFMLRRAVQRSTSTFAEHCKPVTTTQYGALVILSERDGISQKELGDLLFLDRTTTAVAVSKLDEKGLIIRRRDKADARRMVLSLSKAGTLAVPKLNRRALEAQDILLENLTDAEKVTLDKLLCKLVGQP